MRINHNIPALQSYNSIRVSDRKLTESMKRLTTGYKINSSKDDSAGLALSNRMRMQIVSLEMANRNSMDGISLVQTADGALNEVQSIVQRMRELAVQGATDSLEDEDRQKIQDEIDQLLEEIDSISYKTEFNQRRLFGKKDRVVVKDENGKINNGTYENGISGNFPPSEFEFTIDSVGEECISTIKFENLDLDGKQFEIDGNTGLNYTGTDIDKYIEDTKNYVESLGYKTELDGTVLTIISDKNDKMPDTVIKIGGVKDSYIEIKSGSKTIITGPTKVIDDLGNEIGIKESKVSFNSLELILDTKPESSIVLDLNIENGKIGGKDIEADGSINGGLEQKFEIRDNTWGDIIIQVGSEQYMELNIKLPEVSTKSLGLKSLYTDGYIKREDSEKAITICDKALNQISYIRSNIGAYENRLEHTTRSLDVSLDNVSLALSRIMDTDMGREMTEYTSQSVINQAGMSILAQANQRPQQVLQLLGNR